MRTNKEILAVVNQMVSDGQVSQDVAEKYFPELRGSEDERIRTFLHHTFTAQYLCKDKLGKWHGEPVANILAWLEKQGEQKPDIIIPKFRVGDIVKSKSQPMLNARKIISIGKDCYWREDRGCIGFAWEDDCELVEQNHSWGEEDEQHIDSLLKRLDGLCRNEFERTRFAISEDVDWLLSLKDRYTWKPSDEQMNALREAVIEMGKSVSRCSIEEFHEIESLYNDLKKLRGE